MRTSIYIAVRGGCVQGVRFDRSRPDKNPNDLVDCCVVDYDNYEHGDGEFATVEDFERDALGGRTWKTIERKSKAVW